MQKLAYLDNNLHRHKLSKQATSKTPFSNLLETRIERDFSVVSDVSELGDVDILGWNILANEVLLPSLKIPFSNLLESPLEILFWLSFSNSFFESIFGLKLDKILESVVSSKISVFSQSSQF